MEFALREQASWMLHTSLKRCGPGKIAMADGKNNVGREKNRKSQYRKPQDGDVSRRRRVDTLLRVHCA